METQFNPNSELYTKEEKLAIKIQEAKNLNIQGYLYGIEKIETAKAKVFEIQKNPQGKTGKDIFEAKINFALAKAELDTFIKMYKEDFGTDIPVI